MKRSQASAVAAAVAALLLAPPAGAQEGTPPEGVGGAFTEPLPPVPGSVDELVGRLSSPDATVRAGAVRQLGERPTPAAVPALIGVLRGDPVAEVRGWAARTLFTIGTPEARSAVVDAARSDPDERVRAMAARLTGFQAPEPAPVGPPPPQAPTVYAAGAAVAPPPPARPRDPGRGLRRGGWITAGVSYGLALLTGAGLMSTGDRGLIDWGWKMMLPVVGPVVASMTNLEGDEAAISVWFWMWTAAEAVGVILLAVGYSRSARAAERDEAFAARRQGSPLGFAVAPGGPGGLPGLSVAGWFW